jgi:hypothetical protein
MQKHKQILLNHNLEFEIHFQSVIQIVETGLLRSLLRNFQVKSDKMGQVLALLLKKIEQPWKEKIETNEGKVVSAEDPKFKWEYKCIYKPYKCRYCNASELHNSDSGLTGSEEFCPYYYYYEAA